MFHHVPLRCTRFSGWSCALHHHPFVSSDLIGNVAFCCVAAQVRMSHTRCRLELSLRGSSRASRLPCFECTCTLARDLHTHLRVYKHTTPRAAPLITFAVCTPRLTCQLTHTNLSTTHDASRYADLKLLIRELRTAAAARDLPNLKLGVLFVGWGVIYNIQSNFSVRHPEAYVRAHHHLLTSTLFHLVVLCSIVLYSVLPCCAMFVLLQWSYAWPQHLL